MKSKTFKEIYDQFTPDEEVVNELFDKLGKDKPKIMPLKPIMAVIGAAAVIALSFGVTRIIPDDPIAVIENTYTSSSSAEPEESEHSVIVTTAVQTAQNAPISTTTSRPETNHTWEPAIPDETAETTSSDVTALPPLTSVATEETGIATTTEETVIATTTEETDIATTTEETTAVTTTTAETTSAASDTSDEEAETEDEADIPEDDEEIADEDTEEFEELPELSTLSEYTELLGLSDTAYIGYESYFTIGSTTFSSFNNKEFDLSSAEAVLSSAAGAAVNPDAPTKNEDGHFSYYRLSVEGKFYIDFLENGTMCLTPNTDSGYLDTVIFSGDTAAYVMLDEYVKEITREKTNNAITESDETEVSEVEPEEEHE